MATQASGPTPASPTAPVATPAAPSRPSLARIAGIDMARALAIVGMLAVHIGPSGDDDVPLRLYSITHGRASVLFMLLAGVGVTLLASSRRRRRGHVVAELAWRAAVLLPVGLALQLLEHRVLVILPQYAALFLLAIALAWLGDRWLLALAALSAILGTTGFLAGRVLAPETFNRAALALGDPPFEIIRGLFLTGPYPIIVWSTPFLMGIWLGRRDLRSRRVQLTLAVAGGIVAALAAGLAAGLESIVGDPDGWLRIVTNAPHSQMPLWIVGSTGSAAMVLGISLMVANRFPRLTWPLVAMGQLALTIYVSHLLVLHRWRDVLASDEVVTASLVVLAFSACAALFAVLWRIFLPRGPLESLLRPPWDLLSRLYHRALPEKQRSHAG